jgi:hypothetical protein
LAQSPLVVFQSGFEYSGGNPVVGTNSGNLNFADGQIGEFFDMAGSLPAGAGGDFAPELIGFAANPNGGQLLYLDRPNADGILRADLTKEISTAGARVSFDIGTRRTQGNRNKDYDIVGFDTAGNESFHLRVIAESSGTPSTRLAVITGGGATETFDLPGTADDSNGDLSNIGAPPFTVDDIANIALELTDSDYTISFMRDDIAYLTGPIAFNESTDMLARIEFQFQGGGNDGLRTGFILDNLTVVAAPEPTTLAIWSLLGLALGGFGYVHCRRKR